MLQRSAQETPLHALMILLLLVEILHYAVLLLVIVILLNIALEVRLLAQLTSSNLLLLYVAQPMVDVMLMTIAQEQPQIAQLINYNNQDMSADKLQEIVMHKKSVLVTVPIAQQMFL